MDKIKALWNRLLALTLWKVVFWWKKRTGWIDLGKKVEVTGTIIRVDKNVEGFFNDGDVTFNVQLAPEDEWVITLGNKRTAEDNHVDHPAIHCEITPWDRPKFEGVWQQLEVGKRVRVVGQWGFDGVHTGKPEWLEVLYALFRHQPNMNEGWFELHPVTELEILP